MASFKLPNLITALVILTLLIISFTGGIYGALAHQKHNKKLRMQSIVRHELAEEHARRAGENVERQMNLERGRVKEEEDEEDERGGRRVGEREKEGVGKGRGDELGDKSKRVTVALNGVEIDVDTGHELGNDGMGVVDLEGGEAKDGDEEKRGKQARKKKVRWSLFGRQEVSV